MTGADRKFLKTHLKQHLEDVKEINRLLRDAASIRQTIQLLSSMDRATRKQVFKKFCFDCGGTLPKCACEE
jgi:hypothetical protein